VRKWSIRDEIDGGGEKKRQRRSSEDVNVEEEEDDDDRDVLHLELTHEDLRDVATSPLISLPPLSACVFPETPGTPTPLFPDRVLPPILPRLQLQIPSTPMLTRDALVEASQKATHETNLRRRELEAAEEKVRDARAKYDDARILAERLRGDVKRVERGYLE
jgi:hypothetical protein